MSPIRPYLTDLGIAGAKFARAQRVERADVGQHQRGLMKGADEVLAMRRIDRGLAADRGIDLREQESSESARSAAPRRTLAAAKPARSPITPPPSAMTRSRRSIWAASKPSQTSAKRA